MISAQMYVNRITHVFWNNDFNINFNTKNSRIYVKIHSGQQKIHHFTFASKGKRFKKVVMKTDLGLRTKVMKLKIK